MNNHQSSEKEEIICHCSGTTETKINTLIANGINTLEKIVNMTGATTGCGACDYLVVQLIAQGGETPNL